VTDFSDDLIQSFARGVEVFLQSHVLGWHIDGHSVCQITLDQGLEAIANFLDDILLRDRPLLVFNVTLFALLFLDFPTFLV
jgi:hypothetical protein